LTRGRYRLTPAAAEDVRAILRESGRRFGPRQRDAYEQLIRRAAIMVGERPDRSGARDRSDLLPGLRSFTVELAANRRGAAAHVLYYLVEAVGDGPPELLIARVLHRAMDPARHIAEPTN
jgi:plasmid stabilization system protein ParE